MVQQILTQVVPDFEVGGQLLQLLGRFEVSPSHDVEKTGVATHILGVHPLFQFLGLVCFHFSVLLIEDGDGTFNE